MSDSWITCCPGCGTCFRVDEAQFSVARGLVRCGACLHVFTALDHLLDPDAGHDSDEYGSEFDDVPDEQYEERPDPEVDDLPEVKLEADEPGVGSAPDVPVARVEELSVWREDEPPGPDDEVEPLEVDEEEVPELTSLVDASELTEEERRILREALAFEPDEEIETFPEPRSIAEWGGWILLNLVMIGTLVLQYAWFNRDTLSELEALRGWYEMACVHISCELPDFVDFSRMEARDLVVRTHPRVPNALIVDAILYNSSAYAQPFPQLDLSFSNINNKRVAARRFRPDEYLHGEVASYRKIPGRTEVRLSLEIVDPGDSAVSYQLEVVRI